MTLDGGEWLASCLGCFTPITYWIRDWAGSRVARRNIPTPCWEV